jgi:hypothetical protein
VEAAEAALAAVGAVAENSIVAGVIVVDVGALPEAVALVVGADVVVIRTWGALGQVAGVSVLVALVGTLGSTSARISCVVRALSCSVAGIVGGAEEPVVTRGPLGQGAAVGALVAGVRALRSTHAGIAAVEEASPRTLELTTLVIPVAENTVVTRSARCCSGAVIRG